MIIAPVSCYVEYQMSSAIKKPSLGCAIALHSLREMIGMKRLLVVVVCVVAVISVTALAQNYNYTIAPWQYGVLVWVQTPSINQQQFIGEAAQAVQDVFSFWDLPVPVPDPDWATPTQTSSQAWWNMVMKNPELFLAEGENPFLSPMQLALGTPFPGDDPEHKLIVPFPAWGEWKIMPLTLGVFPNCELMNRLFEDYTFSGRFGSVAGYTMFRSKESWPKDEYALVRLFPNVESIILSPQGDTQFILLHELAHWASWMWCEEHGVDFSSLPGLLIEGFADYTAYSLTHNDSWRTIAAAWAQQGGDLADVPRPLLYEVGTSIVSLLVHEKGKDGLLEMLVDPAMDWENVISLLTPAWRESLADVVLSAADLARYEATLEDFPLCRRLLAPILPREAYDIVDQLYDSRGTIEDIDRFWDLISQIPPEPSEEAWQAMIARIPSFEIVQSRDSDPDIRMVRAHVQIRLDKYAEKRDWKSFYETFIEGLRTVVAHYGALPVTSEPQ